MIETNPVGWPRPRLPIAESKRKEWMPQTYPVPWTGKLDDDGLFEPEGVDLDRSTRSMEEWLCQMCGAVCQEQAFAPVSPADAQHEDYDFTFPYYRVPGGPLCSARCSQLVLAVCPHFGAEGIRIISFVRTDTQIFDEQDLVVTAWTEIKSDR